MLRSFGTISGLTLLSRLFGFVRDLVLAATLGAGPVADAFMLAFRLPNHFRAILAEGAFNGAFVPTYAALAATEGPDRARGFRSGILAWLLLANGLLLAAALFATGALLLVLAPGLAADDPQRPLVMALTRITFPYLICMSVVVLLSGVLNAAGRFAAAAGASVLLNITMIATMLGVAWFPSAAHAAAWGVLAGGVAQVLLVGWDAARAGLGVDLAWPRIDPATGLFFRRLGPAILTSGAVQVAVFADTMLATFLPTGALSHLYYADRLYQLPLGVIGIALGTLLLPNVGRRVAEGDEAGLHKMVAQALLLCLATGLPLMVIFAGIGDWVIAVLFQRGAFDGAAVQGAYGVLVAYAVGLVPGLAIRTLVAGFQGRGDMTTPLRALIGATLVNLVLKAVLAGPVGMGAAGLALATSAGVWIYAGLLYRAALKAGHILPPDPKNLMVLVGAAAVSGGLVWLAREATLALATQLVPAAPMLVAGLVLGLAVAAIFAVAAISAGIRRRSNGR
jgi:putative peptidoglycan lipid II flippase